MVNDLIRKAREIEGIRAKLIAAEQSGFTDKTPGEMLHGFKKKARLDGKL